MHVVHARAVMTLEEALDRLGRMIGQALDWTVLESFLLRRRIRNLEVGARLQLSRPLMAKRGRAGIRPGKPSLRSAKKGA